MVALAHIISGYVVASTCAGGYAVALTYIRAHVDLNFAIPQGMPTIFKRIPIYGLRHTKLMNLSYPTV